MYACCTLCHLSPSNIVLMMPVIYSLSRVHRVYLVRCNARNYRCFLNIVFFNLSCTQALMFPLPCLSFIHLFCLIL